MPSPPLSRRQLNLAAATTPLLLSQSARAEGRWSVDRANEWHQRAGWLVGANYAPAYAINQLEMWQADTFDPKAIDRELGWGRDLGFNSMRVFLHDLLWQQDSAGFLKRIDRYLDISEKHGIGTMFVLFDSVWDPHPHLGPQRSPTPGLHNSGWVQSPGAEILRDPSRHDSLKPYVQGVIKRFGKDKRVQCWDMINEPDNTNGSSYRAWEPPNKGDLATALLKKSFDWAREVEPSQPLTCGVWIGDWSDPEKLPPWARYSLDQSDIITYHCYDPLPEMEKRVGWLRRHNRPILCTEYMARPMGSTFQSIVPYLKQQGVGAYNWGFVQGKSQTIFPWDSWKKAYTGEPPVWFHDIFRGDGKPYREEEVAFLRSTLRR